MKKHETNGPLVAHNYLVKKARKGFRLLDFRAMQPDLVSFASNNWRALLGSCSQLKLDIISQNIAMKALDEWPMASSMLESVRQHFLRATMVSYNTLLGSYEKVGSWSKAVELFQLRHGLQVDEFTLSSMISACHLM